MSTLSPAQPAPGEPELEADEVGWLLKIMPDPALLSDGSGRLVMTNHELDELFGYRSGELLGQQVDILVPKGSRQDHPQHRAEYANRPMTRPMGAGLLLFGEKHDGSRFPVEISLSSICTPNGRLTLAAVRDLTARHATDQEISRLAALVESTNDAIIGMTMAGDISSWNRAATEMFGYDQAEMIGTSVAVLLPEGHDLGEVDQMLARIDAGERIENYDAVRKCKDGTEIDVSVCLSAIRDHAGLLIGASKVLSDIARRKRAEEALAMARDAAEATSAEFEAFSYSVAHDLRTPLRAVDGQGLALLEDYGHLLDDVGLMRLDRMRQGAVRMGDLIDSLLSLAQLTNRELAREPVDLSGLVTALAQRLQESDPDRVTVIVQDGVTGWGDQELLSVVLNNLMSNAWKFTRETVGAQVEFGRDTEGYFVRDNGAGFDMAFSTKLFGVFQRLHTQEEFEGTGIGLAMVQRIVHRHGGRIWANGKRGSGATFHFTLQEPTR